MNRCRALAAVAVVACVATFAPAQAQDPHAALPAVEAPFCYRHAHWSAPCAPAP